MGPYQLLESQISINMKQMVEVGTVVKQLTVVEIKGRTAVCRCSCGKFPVNRTVKTILSGLATGRHNSCCSDCKKLMRRGYLDIRTDLKDQARTNYIPDHR